MHRLSETGSHRALNLIGLSSGPCKTTLGQYMLDYDLRVNEVAASHYPGSTPWAEVAESH